MVSPVCNAGRDTFELQDSRMSFPPTITEAAAAIRSGQLTSVALVEQCLGRIDRFDEKIHAWVLVDRDGALKRAELADCELLTGCDRGPLHGIPIGVKDVIDVNGWPTRYGSSSSSPDPKRSNADVVAKLGHNGAILLGKTVTCEWACFDPSPTRNPWNKERTPGGSSSGSAAAVASGTCLAALGTQTGGSIVRPASYCGVVGFKPSFGLCSTDGVFPLSPSLDHVGMIARTVEDACTIFRVIRDRSMQKPETGPTANPAYRLGMIDSPTEFIRRSCETDVLSSFHIAVNALSRAGATVERTALSLSFEDAIADHRTIMSSEAATSTLLMSLRATQSLAPRIRQLLDDGSRVTEGELLRAFAGKAEVIRIAQAVCERFDALVMPSVSTPPPNVYATGDPSFQAIWSLVGLPTITIPCGLSSEGLPVGLQLIGPRNGEGALCQVAAWCERAIGFNHRPPLD
jgi:aspartyl-tRNA(Asn)/glutamyl-tRNA(Gln) amidotransferase subunit A